MKPFIGIAYYRNNKGQSDQTIKEFIWTGSLDMAESMMEIRYSDAQKVTVEEFLSIEDFDENDLIEKIMDKKDINAFEALRYINENS